MLQRHLDFPSCMVCTNSPKNQPIHIYLLEKKVPPFFHSCQVKKNHGPCSPANFFSALPTLHDQEIFEWLCQANLRAPVLRILLGRVTAPQTGSYLLHKVSQQDLWMPMRGPLRI